MENVESFYPLSPMQQGMLFHSLAEPETGMYVELASVRLSGKLNIECFQKAWQTITDRHPILRTSFVWENVKEPIQVVQKKMEMPVKILDWRSSSVAQRKEKLAQYLHKEQMQGFKLTRAPLMHLALILMGEGVADQQEYNFIWTYHHILLDGWSVPLLLQEVMGLYIAYNRGFEPQLSPVRPYRDYIVWLNRQDLSKSESYWRGALADFYAPTPLVVTKLDKKALSSEPDFAEVEIGLTVSRTLALQNLARKNQVTLNTIIQGAWAILLSRYSGEENVVFGATVSGRPYDLPGVEQMIGLFINTLPVKVNVPPEVPLSQWLRELQSNQAELRQYEYTPLAQVQSWSQVPRGTPLFESILVFENFPVSNLDGGGQGNLDIHSGVFASHTNFPMTLVATPDENFSLKISYNRQLFDQPTITRILDHLQVILDGMIANPEIQVDKISILTEGERRLMLTQWNVREADFGTSDSGEKQLCIHEWVENQVSKRPDAIAVRYQNQSISYAELNQRANVLAVYLQHLGVGPESLVGIYMERNIDLLVAILGILKAGGAYVPLDPAYPAERLAFIVADYSKYMGSAKSALITQESMLSALPETDARILSIDSEWPEICQQVLSGRDGQVIDNLTSGVRPENLAYVIYTSGSTGKPKGVMVTHANVTRLFKATDAWYHFNEKDVWTLFHSYAFDFSVWEIWGALFYGGRLIVVPYLTSRSPDLFYQLLIHEGVTVLNQTPSAFRQLMLIDETAPNRDALNLRYIIFGGEALELQGLRPWFLRHGDQKPLLVNMYGITETTVHVTYRPIYLDDLDTAPGSVIGRAIPDLEVYILDKNQEPSPIGVPGELYVGGAGVARGYLNRTELTDQKFIMGLFERNGGQRVYRSGDLARYLPNGDIEYLGRIDMQVKIRGFRIELGEIESVLVQYPEIRQAIVLATGDPGGHKQLVAFLMPKQAEKTIQLTDLRNEISQLLPDYMLPARYYILDSFPLTTNGKIDQRALLAMSKEETSLVTAQQAYEPPVTLEEIKLAQIWSQILRVDQVSRNDNFFALGGDSIVTIQLISRAKGAGFEISYRQIFEHPVLSDLARELSTQKSSAPEQGLVTGVAPLTPVQRWFFEHHADSPQKFNTSLFLAVSEPLDPDILKATLENLLLHHDQLRAGFLFRNGEWVQAISGMVKDVPFNYYDMSGTNEADRHNFIQAKAEEIQSSFKLDQPPLVRLAYFDCSSACDGRLLLVFHHLVIDGVSIRIFIEDFLSTYIQLLAGSEVQLPEKTTSYQEWATRLLNYANSDLIRGEKEYWQEIAEKINREGYDNDFTHIKLDHPDGKNTYGSVKDITCTLSEAETQAIVHDIPIKYSVSTHTVLLTALVRALANETGKSRLLVEMEGHGREAIPHSGSYNIDLSRSIGWFTSIYPLYIEISKNKSVANDLSTVTNFIKLLPQRGIGYGILKYLRNGTNNDEPIRRIPQPEINFNYLGRFDQLGVDIPELTIQDKPRTDSLPARSLGPITRGSDAEQSIHQSPLQVLNEAIGHEQNPESERSALLYLVAAVSGGKLGIRWLYSQAIHEHSTILRLSETYLAELKTIIGEMISES